MVKVLPAPAARTRAGGADGRGGREKRPRARAPRHTRDGCAACMRCGHTRGHTRNMGARRASERTRAIGKAAGIVTLERLVNERFVGLLVHLRLRRRRPERKIEAVMLGLCLVEPQVVEASHFIVGIVDLPSRGGRRRQRLSVVAEKSGTRARHGRPRTSTCESSSTSTVAHDWRSFSFSESGRTRTATLMLVLDFGGGSDEEPSPAGGIAPTWGRAWGWRAGRKRRETKPSRGKDGRARLRKTRTLPFGMHSALRHEIVRRGGAHGAHSALAMGRCDRSTFARVGEGLHDACSRPKRKPSKSPTRRRSA